MSTLAMKFRSNALTILIFATLRTIVAEFLLRKSSLVGCFFITYEYRVV